jgi:NodT family efflux transporter outer membrane factor (OMF) lipoprotein
MVQGGKAVLIAAGLSLLSACAVGPDYQRPDAPMTARYKEQPVADTGMWQPARPGSAADGGAWWSVFGDPVLDDLLAQVKISNQNVKAYEAAYRQAVAVADAARASFFPTLSLGASDTRAQTVSSSRLTGGSSVSTVATSASASVSASWAPDIWGKIRRTVEEQQASAEASAADLAAAELSAKGSLAADYFTLRYEDALKHLLQQTVEAYDRSLQITRNQYVSGTAARADVAQAEAQLASARAQLVATGVQRAQMEHAIAVLVGKVPAEFSIADNGLLPQPPQIPVGLPSALLERRPDIASDERKVASANAAIGVAVAAYFPSLTLSGSSGFSSSSLGSLLQASNNVWSVGPQLALTIFDAGAREAQVEEARAAYDQAVANYRQQVLSSFQGIEDQLASLKVLAQEAEVQNQAVAASEEAERLIFNQYKAGTVAYTSVVTAQATALSAKQSALSLAASRLSAAVTLIQDLGGGWERPTEAASAE